MATPDPLQLYPLSTLGGQAIPFEVIRPYSLLRVDITDAVSADIAIPVAADFLIIEADIECIIRFAETSAAVPASGTEMLDAMHIYPGTAWTIDHNGAAELTVIGVVASETGNLWVNTTKKWKDIQKPTVSDRT